MRVQTLSDRLLEAARRAGFATEIYGKVGAYSLPAFTRLADGPAPSLYISAGIHGDEPAGPLAILDLLRKKAFPATLNVTLCPLLNPLGLERGSRENPDGIDLNRDYGPAPAAAESRLHKAWLDDRRFDLALCLHEDCDAVGAYIYELMAEGAPSHAQALLDAMEPSVGIDPGEIIDGMPALRGLMNPPREMLHRDRPDVPEALRLFFHHDVPRVYTTETPSAHNIVRRVEAQVAAVRAAFPLCGSAIDAGS